jgi:hypothetical protein
MYEIDKRPQEKSNKNLGAMATVEKDRSSGWLSRKISRALSENKEFVIWGFSFFVTFAIGGIMVIWISLDYGDKEFGLDSVLQLDILSKNDGKGVTSARVDLVRSPRELMVLMWLQTSQNHMPSILISNLKNRDCRVAPVMSAADTAPCYTFLLSYNDRTVNILTDPDTVTVIDIDTERKDSLICDNFVQISCLTNYFPHRSTFTDRSIHVNRRFYEPFLPTVSDIGVASVVNYSLGLFDFEAEDGFRVLGAKQGASGPSGQIWNVDGPVTIIWRDTWDALLRDAILLASGALFGLAGAFLVEAIKTAVG